MTDEERKQIFNKEVLTIPDLAKLLNFKYSQAAQIMRELKSRQDRLGMKGRIHKQDYFEILNLNPADYQNKSEVA